MKITFDDRLLLVGSEDGTLIIWIIVNSDGKTAAIDSEHGKCSDIIVPRNDLIEKIGKIETLETRLSQLSTEYSFEMEHARKMQSLQLQKTCETYEKTIDELTKKQFVLEEKYRDELNVIKAAIEEKNIEHSNQLIELEAKLCEKILTESNKSAALKTKMDSSKEEYEKLLRKSADCLQETTEILEKKFDAQLKQRDDQIRKLLDEIQTKKEEFFHYCNQLNLDHERKVAQLSLKYETQLKETNDELFKWRTDASILKKKIDGTSMSYTQLKNDITILIDENNKNKKYICQLEQNLMELQREIDMRNKLVDDKEMCLKTTIEKNDALEKLKNLFNERAIELEAQIQPLNDTIKGNHHQTINLKKLEQILNQKINDLNIEISNLNDRHKVITNDLKMEQTKSFRFETQIQRMCSDLNELIENIQNISKMKEVALSMFQKYVNSNSKLSGKPQITDKSIKSNVNDTAADRRKLLKKSNAEQIISPREHSEKMKLVKENLFLISEIDKLKESNREYQEKIMRLESIMEIKLKSES